MAIEPVAEPPEPVHAEIFLHRFGVDVPHAATVEIARSRVMGGVRALPVIVGRQGEDAEGAPDPVVDRPGAEEGAVAAIVQDHEEAHQETRRRKRKRERKPVADMQQRPHRRPEGDERRQCHHDFGDAPYEVRVAIARQRAGQSLQVRQKGGGGKSGFGLGHRVSLGASVSREAGASPGETTGNTGIGLLGARGGGAPAPENENKEPDGVLPKSLNLAWRQFIDGAGGPKCGRRATPQASPLRGGMFSLTVSALRMLGWIVRERKWKAQSFAVSGGLSRLRA